MNSSEENLKHAKWECKYPMAIARRFMDRTKNFVGLNFWAKGYCVSTVGGTERKYARTSEREKEDRRFDQLKMFE